MKKLITVLVVVFMLVLSVGVVLAGGDKVHGNKGTGPTVQECVSFENCPYGKITPTP